MHILISSEFSSLSTLIILYSLNAIKKKLSHIWNCVCDVFYWNEFKAPMFSVLTCYVCTAPFHVTMHLSMHNISYLNKKKKYIQGIIYSNNFYYNKMSNSGLMCQLGNSFIYSIESMSFNG